MKSRNCYVLLLMALLVQGISTGCSILSKSGNPSVTAQELKGITLIARDNMHNIDEFTSFGSNSAPSNATCEFVANGLYTSKYGNVFEMGDSFTIGNATILEHTDGYGNSGTKLILESASPKEGLTLYCYAWEPKKKRFWALDKDTVMNILSENFEIED